MTTINFTDSTSAATTFATKLLTGVLNFYHDFSDWSGDFREITRNETWFSTDVIERLRRFTSDMEISRLEFTDIIKNPDSSCCDSETREVTLFAWNRSHEEIKVATFTVSRDWLDGEYATGWTKWNISNVMIKVTGQDVQLVSEDCPEAVNLSDVIWGRIVRPKKNKK